MRLLPDFREFLKLLNQAQTEYLVIGGYAVGFHGYARTTKDIDIWVNDDPRNITRLVGALRQFGFDTPALTQWARQPRQTLRLGYPPARIEVLTVVSGVIFNEAFSRGVPATLDGIATNILSLPDLLANKRAAGRPHDLADLDWFERGQK